MPAGLRKSDKSDMLPIFTHSVTFYASISATDFYVKYLFSCLSLAFLSACNVWCSRSEHTKHWKTLRLGLRLNLINVKYVEQLSNYNANLEPLYKYESCNNSITRQLLAKCHSAWWRWLQLRSSYILYRRKDTFAFMSCWFFISRCRAVDIIPEIDRWRGRSVYILAPVFTVRSSIRCYILGSRFYHGFPGIRPTICNIFSDPPQVLHVFSLPLLTDNEVNTMRVLPARCA